MKLITKNSQIVVGATYNIYYKTSNTMAYKEIVVLHANKEHGVQYKYCGNISCVLMPEDTNSGYYFELVSYPPRRPVTLEWCKENLAELNILDVYSENGNPRKIQGINQYGFYLDQTGQFIKYEGERKNKIYIDPPHPEVPDVHYAFEVKAEQKSVPEPEKRSLWWFDWQFGIELNDGWKTESEFLSGVQKTPGMRYQPVTRPVHEGPDENEWRSV